MARLTDVERSNAEMAGRIAGLILMAITAPLLAIWCVNTLFATQIAYTLLNWFCVFLLIGIVHTPKTPQIE